MHAPFGRGSTEEPPARRVCPAGQRHRNAPQGTGVPPDCRKFPSSPRRASSTARPARTEAGTGTRGRARPARSAESFMARHVPRRNSRTDQA